MNAAIPILALAAIGTTIAYAARKTAAAEDLKIGLDSVQFNPFKDIKGGTATAQIGFAVRNIRKASLTMEAIDLEIQLKGRTIATIREFGKPRTIKGISSNLVKIPATGNITGIVLAFGSSLVKSLADGQSQTEEQRESVLKRIMPKSVKVVGNIRAEGQVIAFDEEIELKP